MCKRCSAICAAKGRDLKCKEKAVGTEGLQCHRAAPSKHLMSAHQLRHCSSAAILDQNLASLISLRLGVRQSPAGIAGTADCNLKAARQKDVEAYDQLRVAMQQRLYLVTCDFSGSQTRAWRVAPVKADVMQLIMATVIGTAAS
eukprot:819-Heterococcus_DN1.PRE.5